MKVRAAKKEDRQEILAFCRGTFSWGDYIDRVWDVWFSDRRGRLLVGEQEGRRIAVAHVALCPGGRSAWLEGVRVHPGFRRAKVATALLEEMLAYAGRRGARQASAIVAEDNIASQRMLEKSGFTVISRWTYYSTGRKLGPLKSAARLAGPADLPEAWDYLQQSTTYRQSAGRYMNSWQWCPLDKRALQRLIGEGQVVVKGRPVGGIAIVNSGGYWDRKDVLQVAYLDSLNVKDLVSFAVNLYAGGKFSNLHILCNESKHTASVIEKLRIKESERFLLYSKDFTE
jgi:ribosomal protein S18 acetylase RimI-like enzyme